MNVLPPSIYDGIAPAARDWFVHWAAHQVPSEFYAPLSSLDRFQQTAGRIDELLFNDGTLLYAGAAGQIGVVGAPSRQQARDRSRRTRSGSKQKSGPAPQ
ncbi:hypothetical protein [Burkholderia anthina]|uniref:hypothetical protein n=1 Tax=Burkholderia anthina TaxID=179879 RepID=UPI0021BBDF9C|nr:hypothetical protein [Burkholderia anthina]